MAKTSKKTSAPKTSKKPATKKIAKADPKRDGTCSYCGEDAYCACPEGPNTIKVELTEVQSEDAKDLMESGIPENEAVMIVTEMTQHGPVDHIVEQVLTKPQTKSPKSKPAPKADMSKTTRDAILKVLADAGFKGSEKGGWYRFDILKSKLSFQAKGSQVHFRKFDFQAKGVEQVSEQVAKEKGMGSIRQLMSMDAVSPKDAVKAIEAAIASAKK